jgi:exodeoxyribonuclease VII small subunit
MVPKKTPEPTETFESALERIEQIAAQMESGDLPLEQLVVVYEEGLRLVRFCSERLDAAEKRLQTITRDAAGQPQGVVSVQSPGEIPPSTTPEASVTEKGSPSSGAPGARLF